MGFTGALTKDDRLASESVILKMRYLGEVPACK